MIQHVSCILHSCENLLFILPFVSHTLSTAFDTNCFLASYGSCANAIRSFDKLYELYNSKISGNEPNPMRLTGSTDMEGNKVYVNTRFPINYIFTRDSEGVQTLIYPADNTEIYAYISLDQNADDNPKANCYVDLGDLKSGQDAMETCDESFSLLLGNITSFGTLASIVDNFDEYGLAGSCCRKFLLTMLKPRHECISSVVYFIS